MYIKYITFTKKIIIVVILEKVIHNDITIGEKYGHNKIVSLFAAVNESTWEHIKIALTPTFICTLYDGAIYGVNENYFIAKTSSILVIIILIPLLFYAYQLITKKLS